MQFERRYILIALLPIFSIFLFAAAINADTVLTKDGKELRGIVVEDYKDRIVFSTADGEVSVMKADINELYYDSEEENLIKLADLALERNDNIRAFAYYDKAFKINPNSKRAKDGIVFLQGYLFRKEQLQKEDAVKRQGDFERLMETGPAATAPDADMRSASEKLNESIGFTFNPKGNSLEISYVLPGSPAADAGIKKGDLLIAMWGKLTGYMSMDDVVTNILEKSSMEVKCTIGRTIDISAKRGSIFSGTKDIIGAAFSMEFDGLTVSEIKDNGPAAQAGLQKRDLVMSINGDTTRYMPLKKAIELIKNFRGETIRLTIRRDFAFWRK